ncbi:Ca2+:H+ antiporter [Sphingomonas naasensis]|uniref:Ionic transporter y4hA n=1 Tax=Sphingomonas naasensis TaxID=1344951 RepID=A0A4S1W8N2_9SPHN|nr:ionic transporter y4hA [Sphingomonas naasensis]NIJ19516.1 Ca2+:H+ antiporter [Sphingomonas naasensis]TGX39251.1 ionic transporter y4hA [Sphingomonas naasensis]
MAMTRIVQHWVWAVPAAAWLLLLAGAGITIPPLLLGVVLIATVLAAVHHAEVVAHRVGEPFGTFLLAVAVTVIELGLIITLMRAASAGAATLARDTVFAAVMLILNGLLGVCILVGAIKHREQSFQQSGVSASLAALCALTVLTLVLPNFTVSEPGPAYSPAQLGFVAVVSFLLYATFVMVQTVRHRDYFLPPRAVSFDPDTHADPPSNRRALASLGLLLACLGGVVLLAKALAYPIEKWVIGAGAPQAVVGVIIAALVLLPESVAAVRAALANRLQTSMNLGLGSALATIGLTIPGVAALSLVADMPIALGLIPKSLVLLFLTLIVSTLSLATGRTTILQGVVHLVILGVYLFTTVVP